MVNITFYDKIEDVTYIVKKQKQIIMINRITCKVFAYRLILKEYLEKCSKYLKFNYAIMSLS